MVTAPDDPKATTRDPRLLAVLIAGGSGVLGLPILGLWGLSVSFAGFASGLSPVVLPIVLSLWWLTAWGLTAAIRWSSRVPFASALVSGAVVGLQALAFVPPFASGFEGAVAWGFLLGGNLASVCAAYWLVDRARRHSP